MTEHDPLCQASINGSDDIYFCVCEFIAKVRADEREFLAPEVPMARDDLRNELRAQVEACIQDAMEHYEASDHADWVTAVHAGRTSAFTDVLALIDGGSDD